MSSWEIRDIERQICENSRTRPLTGLSDYLLGVLMNCLGLTFVFYKTCFHAIMTSNEPGGLRNRTISAVSSVRISSPDERNGTAGVKPSRINRYHSLLAWRVMPFFVRGSERLTTGKLEDRISKALTQWEKEYLGRGSVLVKTDVLRNMVIVVLKGILTPAEKKLAESHEGLIIVKRMRSDLVESGGEQLKNLMNEITGVEVESFFTDISTRTGERVMIFTLTNALE